MKEDNSLFGMTDIEAEFIARPADIGDDLQERLVEHCKCVLCQQYYEDGWNIFYFNHTVCKSCIKKSGSMFNNWTKTVCDICRTADTMCYHDKPDALNGNYWHVCRECLVKGAKHYAKYEPDGNYYYVPDQYYAYLKQF
jgi:hypothetical protein